MTLLSSGAGSKPEFAGTRGFRNRGTARSSPTPSLVFPAHELVTTLNLRALTAKWHERGSTVLRSGMHQRINQLAGCSAQQRGPD